MAWSPPGAPTPGFGCRVSTGDYVTPFSNHISDGTPSYSPDLNPDEGLNADLKQAVTRKAPLRSKQALKQAAVSHMRRLAKSPARVRSFFRQKSMRYAA
jgi:hypothetical protein